MNRHVLYPNDRSEEGSVLVLSLLVTLIVLGIGLTAMWYTSSGTRISSNFTRRQEALYAAETGLERARAVLREDDNWSNLLSGSLCTATADDPNGKGNVLCDSRASVGTPMPLERTQVVASSSTTAGEVDMAKVAYTVFIRNDYDDEYSYCYTRSTNTTNDCDKDGDSDTDDVTWRLYNDDNDRVVIRSEGYGKDGLSDVAVEMVISSGRKASNAPGYQQKGGFGGQGSNAMTGATVAVP